ncbi:MAG: flagellar biosynthesis anti-sigma factor FlgM [Treponema sp.]|nr:flagellar biosynthesis anti-sigma factor FlgM [Treponema sp.]
MVVDRLGQLNPVQLENRIGRNDQVRGGDRSDSISLSAEAMAQAEAYQIAELAKAAEVLDEARIAELRERINDPSYFNERTIIATADRIMDAFGL